MPFTLRQKLGAALIDWPRYEWNLRGLALPGGRRGHWTRIGNREDRMFPGPEGTGINRAGRWSTRLHGCAVYPSLGRRLARQSLTEWPISLSPEAASPKPGDPDVSFVMGHRGLDRMPLLLATLRSISAQSDARIECVIVEQSEDAAMAAHLPDWVRYVHTPPPVSGMPYVRSWALNVGARLAGGRLLVFHDGDILVPVRYAAELLAMHGRGYEAMDLKRFVFYLEKGHTNEVLRAGVSVMGSNPEVVLQNARGGSVAVDRTVFFELGGFDEAFVGWGGEDDEFWDRAGTRKAWHWGYLPFVHLWHRPQPDRGDRDRSTAARLEERLRIPPETRIRELSSREFGHPAGPLLCLTTPRGDGA